jgi:hypothetical protein
LISSKIYYTLSVGTKLEELKMKQTHINHEAYQKKIQKWTPEALWFTIRDANDSLKAIPEGHKAGYYADEVHYCAMELRRRGLYDRKAKAK